MIWGGGGGVLTSGLWSDPSCIFSKQLHLSIIIAILKTVLRIDKRIDKPYVKKKGFRNRILYLCN